MEWTDVLTELERTLRHLEASGVRRVNLAPDTELATLHAIVEARPTAAAPEVPPVAPRRFTAPS